MRENLGIDNMKRRDASCYGQHVPACRETCVANASVRARNQVRREQDVVEFEQRVVVRYRLGCEDVQAGSGDFSLPQSFDQRGLVDHGTPCRINQKGCRLHQSQVAG